MNTNKINKAWRIARRVHKGQKRFNGQPYINHIKATVGIIDEMGLIDERRMLLAILHDVLEDGGKFSDIKNFDDKLMRPLTYLTHSKDSLYYDDYIENILNCFDIDVIIVKLADMLQNVTEDPKKKQRAKYREALPKLIRAVVDFKE